jgi:hypothetical protein
MKLAKSRNREDTEFKTEIAFPPRMVDCTCRNKHELVVIFVKPADGIISNALTVEFEAKVSIWTAIAK